MRCFLMVCSLAVVGGCFASEELASSGDDPADEAIEDSADRAVDDSADEEAVWRTDAGFGARRDAGLPWRDASPACTPEKPVAPAHDAGTNECDPFVRLPVRCMQPADAQELVKQFCGELSGSEGSFGSSDPSCPGLVSEVWVSCCPVPRHDASVPTPQDASAPPPPRSCQLLRFGDDRTCLDSESYEREARAACPAHKAELKSIALLNGSCAVGATAAEAVCCDPSASSLY